MFLQVKANQTNPSVIIWECVHRAEVPHCPTLRRDGGDMHGHPHICAFDARFVYRGLPLLFQHVLDFQTSVLPILQEPAHVYLVNSEGRHWYPGKGRYLPPNIWPVLGDEQRNLLIRADSSPNRTSVLFMAGNKNGGFPVHQPRALHHTTRVPLCSRRLVHHTIRRSWQSNRHRFRWRYHQRGNHAVH